MNNPTPRRRRPDADESPLLFEFDPTPPIPSEGVADEGAEPAAPTDGAAPELRRSEFAAADLIASPVVVAPDPAAPGLPFDEAPAAELPLRQDEDLIADADPISFSPATIQPPPQVIPARMLNEFVYCPRLFYYEFVEGVFVESADTERGAVIHERVDRGRGDMPGAEQKRKKDQGRRMKGSGGCEAEDLSASADAESVGDGAGETQVESLAEAKGETRDITSRSVTLGSERLGVIAKLDLVEMELGANGVTRVCPVDYKAGAPRDGEDGATLWDADRMQLGLQCLLLRENGYHCEEGIIFYRATKQRARLVCTPELEAWVLERLEAARRTAAGPIPPPLVASPKCVRCSLAPVCLPDETRMLQRAERAAARLGAAVVGPPTLAGAPLRRLMAARADARALYLNTPGLRVGRADEVLQVRDKDTLKEQVRISDLDHVAVFGHIQVTTQAIQELCEQDVPVSWFSTGGWFYGLTRGHSQKNVFTRIAQFDVARDPARSLPLARAFVYGKIRNQRTLLMRNHTEPPPGALNRLRGAADDARGAGSTAELLGIEGAAAAVYFAHFAGMLKIEDPHEGDDLPGLESPGVEQRSAELRAAFSFDFNGRNRRPPTDPVNALLSLAYSLLAKECTLAAHAVGLDPYVGFFHQPRFGRPALALDLMEEFRPLIADSAVLTAINSRFVTPNCFVRAGSAVNLSKDGRKGFFQCFEKRMNALITHPVFDYKVSYRRALELQFRLLARVLAGEIETYPAFLTR